MDCKSQASLSFTISWSLLKLMSIESVMPSYHLMLCRPLLLPPSMFLSIRVFFNGLALHIRGPKYWRSSAFKIFLETQIVWFCDLMTQNYVWGLRCFSVPLSLVSGTGRRGLCFGAVRGSLGSVRSSEPSTQQLGPPSYLWSQEMLVLVNFANWEREESRSFQGI